MAPVKRCWKPGFPVMIWEGQDDPAHARRKAFADANGLRFLSTAGDHLGMVLTHGVESANGIRDFLDLAQNAPGAQLAAS